MMRIAHVGTRNSRRIGDRVEHVTRVRLTQGEKMWPAAGEKTWPAAGEKNPTDVKRFCKSPTDVKRFCKSPTDVKRFCRAGGRDNKQPRARGPLASSGQSAYYGR